MVLWWPQCPDMLSAIVCGCILLYFACNDGACVNATHPGKSPYICMFGGAWRNAWLLAIPHLQASAPSPSVAGSSAVPAGCGALLHMRPCWPCGTTPSGPAHSCGATPFVCTSVIVCLADKAHRRPLPSVLQCLKCKTEVLAEQPVKADQKAHMGAHGENCSP